MQDLVPGADVVLLDGRAVAENRGIVEQAVEPPELLAQPVNEVEVRWSLGLGEIQNGDGRRRIAGAEDFIVHAFELAPGSAQQYYGGAVGGERERGRATDPVAGPGNEDYPVMQEIGARPVGLGIDARHRRAGMRAQCGRDKSSGSAAGTASTAVGAGESGKGGPTSRGADSISTGDSSS